jgi:hypothetical protein
MLCWRANRHQITILACSIWLWSPALFQIITGRQVSYSFSNIFMLPTNYSSWWQYHLWDGVERPDEMAGPEYALICIMRRHNTQEDDSNNGLMYLLPFKTNSPIISDCGSYSCLELNGHNLSTRWDSQFSCGFFSSFPFFSWPTVYGVKVWGGMGHYESWNIEFCYLSIKLSSDLLIEWWSSTSRK